MYQEWFKEYEKIINEGKKETEYCPMCGRKLKGGIAVEEIKVGDFIRSNDGYIGKITSIRQNPKRECDTYYSCDNCMASGFYEQIKKHSKHIIDVIEVRRLCEWKRSKTYCYV